MCNYFLKRRMEEQVFLAFFPSRKAVCQYDIHGLIPSHMTSGKDNALRLRA